MCCRITAHCLEQLIFANLFITHYLRIKSKVFYHCVIDHNPLYASSFLPKFSLSTPVVGFKPSILGWRISILPLWYRSTTHCIQAPFCQILSLNTSFGIQTHYLKFISHVLCVPMSCWGTTHGVWAASFSQFVYPGASGRIQTLYLKINIQVCYHCATDVQSLVCKQLPLDNVSFPATIAGTKPLS